MTNQNSKNKFLPFIILLIAVLIGYFFVADELNKTKEVLQSENSIDNNNNTKVNLEAEIIKKVDTAKEKEVQGEVQTEEKVKEEKKRIEIKKEEKKQVQKKETKKEEVEEIIIVDTEPQPVGGYAAFYQYVRKNLHYPEEAKEKGIQGQVQVRFQVLKDGSIGKAKILKRIGGGCDQEALRVIRTGIKWTPAQIDGKNIDYYTAIPIVFKLAHIKKEEK